MVFTSKHRYYRLCFPMYWVVRLPLRMCTTARSQSDKAGRVFHTLNSNLAKKLHSAEYLPNAPRLACAVSDGSGNIYRNTFGLSDFMRPSKK